MARLAAVEIGANFVSEAPRGDRINRTEITAAQAPPGDATLRWRDKKWTCRIPDRWCWSSSR